MGIAKTILKYGDKIDAILEGYHKSNYDLIEVRTKILIMINDSQKPSDIMPTVSESDKPIKYCKGTGEVCICMGLVCCR